MRVQIRQSVKLTLYDMWDIAVITSKFFNVYLLVLIILRFLINNEEWLPLREELAFILVIHEYNQFRQFKHLKSHTHLYILFALPVWPGRQRG